MSVSVERINNIGYSIGFNSNTRQDIGYGVPSYCNHPGCKTKIHRGMSYSCDNPTDPCELHFCSSHLFYKLETRPHPQNPSILQQRASPKMCHQCLNNLRPYPPKPDHPQWTKFKKNHPSWLPYREHKSKRTT